MMFVEIANKLWTTFTVVGGAALGVFGKAYFDGRNKSRKHLVIAITDPIRLIFYSQPIAERIEIKVDGHVVRTLANSEVRLHNSGNQVINDVHVQINLKGQAELITTEPLSTALQIEGLVTETQPKRADIRVPFINPGEEVGVRFLTTGPDFHTEVHFRQPEVSHIVRKDDYPELLNPLGMILFSAVRKRPLLSHWLARTDLSYRRFLLSETAAS